MKNKEDNLAESTDTPRQRGAKKKVARKSTKGKKITLTGQRDSRGLFLKGNNIGEPLKYNEQKLIDTYNNYINTCITLKDGSIFFNKCPLLLEFYCLLGITKETFMQWAKLGYNSVADVSKKMKQFSQLYWINKGERTPNPAFSIFMLKAQHRYDDRSGQTENNNQIQINITSYKDNETKPVIEVTNTEPGSVKDDKDAKE